MKEEFEKLLAAEKIKRLHLEPLLQLSRDEVAQVRAAAARGLGTIKDDRATRRRAELASDPEPLVRAAAGGS